MVDLPALVRRDHDEVQTTLAAMSDPEMPISDGPGLVETLQLITTVHSVAEARVLLFAERGARSTRSAAAARRLLDSTRDEHAAQGAMLERVARTMPGSADWRELTLELQVLALDHRWCVPSAYADLRSGFEPPEFDALADAYATARLLARSRFTSNGISRSCYQVARNELAIM